MCYQFTVFRSENTEIVEKENHRNQTKKASKKKKAWSQIFDILT